MSPHRFQKWLAGLLGRDQPAKQQKISARLLGRATKLARSAHQPWVTIFFFLIFFFDSFLMVLPSDPLLGVTLNFVPKKRREWFLASVGGALAGLVIFAFLAQSEFLPRVIEFIQERDLTHSFQEITQNAHKYGYFNLSLAVFTIVPSIICLVGGIIIGLNPLAVFTIVSAARVVRILTVMYLLKGMWMATLTTKEKIVEKIEEKRHRHDAGRET